MNVVYQLGRLSSDLEVNQTRAGDTVINGSVATNRSVKRDGQWTEETTFVPFTMWGKRAEAFAKFHGKGDRCFLIGRLTLDTWEDRNTGKPRSKVKITAEEWEFVTDKGERSGQSSGQPAHEDDTPF